MSNRRILSLFAAASLLSLAMGIAAGGVLGFMKGFGFHAALVAPVEGASLVTTLRLLRELKVANAMELLELDLDHHLLTHNVYLDQGAPLFDFYDFSRHNVKFMTIIAKYRREFPRHSIEGADESAACDIDQAINQVLARYGPTRDPSR